jgi:diphosphomevalonate decarboxylase
MKITAKAHSNIAFVKYWGKRDEKLNLPAVGSISFTLNELFTETSIEFSKNLKKDSLVLNEKSASMQQLERVSKFLDIVRSSANQKFYAKIISKNNFPTGAGLASSASAFASLATAATQAINLNLTKFQLSELARRGSGSAARSIWGGFVEMKIGTKSDGSDSFAVQIADEKYWDIHFLIAITSEKEKKIGSTEGMNHTSKTSPFYKQWIKSSRVDLQKMRHAILTKNFTKLGELTEFSCLKMHAVALSANPGLVYWNTATIECIQEIQEMRKEGIETYFTIDAGPQVKAICQKKDVLFVKSRLSGVKGIKRILISASGPNASILEDKN